MKLKSNISIFIGLIAASLIGCDSFENDIESQGEEVLDLETTVVSLPGTSLFIDLSDKINTSDAVAFNIERAPSKGTAKISESAILTYSPNEDFKSGSDLLVINLINQLGTLLDTDSIVVSIDSLDNIPCFNGALSDYYHTTADSSIIIEPILNDGYCVDETSGAVINFTSQPDHGELEQIELFVYQYQPDSGYIGSDSFMYELELIDQDGNSDLSLAQINIEISSSQDTVSTDSCNVVYQNHLDLTTPIDEYYIIEPFINDSSTCSILDWELDILNVTNGEAVGTQDGFIKFFPANHTSADTSFIEYRVAFLDQVFTNTILISFYSEVDSSNCSTPLQAINDFYQISVVADSILTNESIFEFYPKSNDIFCTDLFIEPSISIISVPDFGSAEVNNLNGINYYFENFTDSTKTTSLLYELCNGQVCDTATVFIELTK